ncbi:hypothetical protein [Bdellovibrio sp. HCB337]|uniref:hypothetical protein n=1 Tax=Bdellovibrio sp. HCB337 TaxID=3394358 RepID=UPI0039A4DD67
MAAAPLPVQEKLRRIDQQLKDSPTAFFSNAIEEELINDRVFAELYVLADVSPFDRTFVKQRFGDYGLDLIHRMLDLKVLRLGTDGKMSLGQNRAAFSAKAIKKVGLQLVQTYLKPERADEIYANHMALYFENLSEKTYRQWVDIDVQAFEDKMACLKEPGAKGSIPAFTFAIVETLKGPSEHE